MESIRPLFTRRARHYRSPVTQSTYRIQGATGKWEIVIAFEAHVRVAAKSKPFSGAATGFGAEPNSQIGLVETAINNWSRFGRKNAFHAGLPQGFQTSQPHRMLVSEGRAGFTARPERWW